MHVGTRRSSAKLIISLLAGCSKLNGHAVINFIKRKVSCQQTWKAGLGPGPFSGQSICTEGARPLPQACVVFSRSGWGYRRLLGGWELCPSLLATTSSPLFPAPQRLALKLQKQGELGGVDGGLRKKGKEGGMGGLASPWPGLVGKAGSATVQLKRAGMLCTFHAVSWVLIRTQ